MPTINSSLRATAPLSENVPGRIAWELTPIRAEPLPCIMALPSREIRSVMSARVRFQYMTLPPGAVLIPTRKQAPAEKP